jgi:manganese transport protein
LYFQQKGFRIIESIVAGLMTIILLSFLYEMIVSQPSLGYAGWIVTKEGNRHRARECSTLRSVSSGATVMPHNLYLHSSIVQTRNFKKEEPGKRSAIRFATIDSTVSLALAFFINGSILILAAYRIPCQRPFRNCRYHRRLPSCSTRFGCEPGRYIFRTRIAGIGPEFHAHRYARRTDRNGRIPQYSPETLGCVVCITSGIAIVPALIVSYLYGERGTAELLVFSQVILSLQLSFAVVPLVFFTSHSKVSWAASRIPGRLPLVSWVIAAIDDYLAEWVFVVGTLCLLAENLMHRLGTFFAPRFPNFRRFFMEKVNGIKHNTYR